MMIGIDRGVDSIVGILSFEMSYKYIGRSQPFATEIHGHYVGESVS